jgi:hypothetical protein
VCVPRSATEFSCLSLEFSAVCVSCVVCPPFSYEFSCLCAAKTNLNRSAFGRLASTMSLLQQLRPCLPCLPCLQLPRCVCVSCVCVCALAIQPPHHQVPAHPVAQQPVKLRNKHLLRTLLKPRRGKQKNPRELNPLFCFSFLKHSMPKRGLSSRATVTKCLQLPRCVCLCVGNTTLPPPPRTTKANVCASASRGHSAFSIQHSAQEGFIILQHSAFSIQHSAFSIQRRRACAAKRT